MRLLVIVLTLAACHPQPIPPPPPPVDGIPPCADSVIPQQEGLCEGLFAQVGGQAYQCFSCGVEQGCLAVKEQVYCVGGCVAQQGLCHLLPLGDGGDGAKPGQRAPKRVPARVKAR